MNGDLIRVDDVRDSDRVAAALQRALDHVLNPASLRRLAEGQEAGRDYCYIYPWPIQPALGGVSLLVGGYGEQADMTALFVDLYLPGRHGGLESVYVPSDVIGRLRVRLDAPGHVKRPFEIDRLNRQARVHMQLPTVTFMRYPHALILTQ